MAGRLSLSIAIAVLASGCTGLSQKIDANVDEGRAKAVTLAGETGRAMPVSAGEATPSVIHDSGIWIGKTPVKIGARPLPPIFYEPATLDRVFGSLSEFAERMTLRSGIPVQIAPEVLSLNPSAPPRPADSQAGAQVPPQPALALRPAMRLPLPPGPQPAPAAPQSVGGSQSQAQGAAAGPVRITYTNGNFKGLLDTVVARYGVSWKYEDGAIRIFHTDARTFQINAIPGDSSFTANVVSGAASTGGTGAGAGSGGGQNGGTVGVSANNSQNTTVASRLSIFSSIESTVRTMLSAYGRVAASPATGSITIVDTPEHLDRIGAYIENENKIIGRQVVVNVTVLSVSLEENDEYGINWDLVYRNLRREYGIVNQIAPSPGATSFSVGVVGNSRFSGTSLIVDALSRQGKVRRQTTASVVTLNNQPVPVQVARQTTYLQSSQTSVVAQVGTVTSLTPGTVTAGFNMSILPHVLSNGTVMLQFSCDLSTLRQIRPVESNGNKIESPELDTRNFLQRVAMKSNETLIISGFEQTDENLDKRGVGEPRNFLLGGGFRAGSNKDVIVVLITPTTVAGS